MSKEDMMNKISFALKDPILQMGFEVICSKLSRLENENAEMKEQLTKAKEIIKDYMTIAKGSHTTVCGVPEENRTIYVLKLNEEARKDILIREDDGEWREPLVADHYKED